MCLTGVNTQDGGGATQQTMPVAGGGKMEDLVGTKQKMRQGADRGMEGGSDPSSSSDQMFL